MMLGRGIMYALKRARIRADPCRTLSYMVSS